MTVFKYKNECRFIGFCNVGRGRDASEHWKREAAHDGFEKALAYLDNAQGGNVTDSEDVFCVRCNAGRDVSELIPATLLSTKRTEMLDKWDGYRQYLVGTYKCPECKKKGEDEKYLYTKEAKSDMQIYGYKGANYGS